MSGGATSAGLSRMCKYLRIRGSPFSVPSRKEAKKFFTRFRKFLLTNKLKGCIISKCEGNGVLRKCRVNFVLGSFGAS